MTDTEFLPTDKPLLVQIIVVWSIVRAVIVVLVLIDWALFIGTTNGSTTQILLQLFVPDVFVALSFLLFGVGINMGKNGGRLGYLILSLFVILRPGPSFITYQPVSLVYSVSAGLIALWLLNQPSVLNYFRANDFRPTWLSRGVFGISWDVLIGIVLLVAALAVEIASLLIAFALGDSI